MMRQVAAGPVLAGGLLLLAQFGGGSSFNSAVDQIERSVTRPVPQAPAAPAQSAPDAWVPDRYLAAPGQGGTAVVPGHWERRLPSGEYYAPPSTVCNSASGECATAPAGVRPPPDMHTPYDTHIAP